jgi:hypothetical protein
MPAVKDVGEPGAGEPHARFDGGELEKEPATAADHGGPRETEGPEPSIAYSRSPRQLPTRPTSAPALDGLRIPGHDRVGTHVDHSARH